MVWINFSLYATIIIVLWAVAIVFNSLKIKKLNTKIFVSLFTMAGVAILAVFIVLLWWKLERPPMRTLGETRLWYAFFLPFVGYITYLRWRYQWFLSYSLVLAIVFISINLAHPENYSKTLMPALQSVWFVPHVIVYIFAYALLAASSLVAVRGLLYLYPRSNRFLLSEIANRVLARIFDMPQEKNDAQNLQKNMNLADNLVYIGFAFLTLGLLFGALWAKEAWGHYWTWDPKETWAFLTWISYLLYMHFRYFHPRRTAVQLWILSLAFVVLLLAWFGINFLPSAQNSVHVYGS